MPRRRLSVLALFLGLVMVASACEPVHMVTNRRGDVDGKYYEFSSGGSFHPDGRGEWIIRLRGDALWVARDKKGKITEYGTFKLTEAEAKRMWKLIDNAAIRDRPASARDDGPAEVRYRFTVMKPSKSKSKAKRAKQIPWTIELWEEEVFADDDLTQLVKYEGKLVRKYTKKKPKF